MTKTEIHKFEKHVLSKKYIFANKKKQISTRKTRRILSNTLKPGHNVIH